MRQATIVAMGLLCSAVCREALAYDCSKGGEQLTIQHTLSLAFGDHPTPAGQNILQLQARTARAPIDYDNCGGAMRVEAWIDGGNGAMVKESSYIAVIGEIDNPGELSQVIQHIPGAIKKGFTKHWFVSRGIFFDSWTSLGDFELTLTVPPIAYDPPPDPDPNTEAGCDALGGEYFWDGDHCVPLNCPIIISRDGEYHLTSPSDGVLFDLDADGIPERIAWTQAGSDDAFLALDRNGNGRIDDGSELFGNRSPAYANRSDVRAANGFVALNFLESPSYGPSRFDQVIDPRDAVFSRLLLWRDKNHNGISEPEELELVADSGIAAIPTDAKENRRTDKYGNEFRLKGRTVWTDGTVTPMYDVWLRSMR